MQMAEETTKVEYVPREQWASLPVQPAAGVWQSRMAPASKGAVLCVPVVLLGGALAMLGALPWWALWVPLVPFTVLACAVGAIAGLAYRPYCAEREHGYTTWEHSED